MTSTVTLSNGQRIWMNVATGEVIDASKTHVTSIEQSAPTVLSDGRTMAVAAGRISSRTDIASELWLRMPDGRERSFHFQNVHVPVRPGHRISVLWGAPVGQEDGWNFGARNHTTGRSSVDLVGAVGAELKQWKLKVGGSPAFLGVIATGMLLGAAAAFVRTESSDRLGYAIVGAIAGGLIGFIASIPLVIALVVNPRAKRLLQEVEQFATDRLAERDPLDTAAVDKEASKTPL